MLLLGDHPLAEIIENVLLIQPTDKNRNVSIV